jgi:hypothetical protein
VNHPQVSNGLHSCWQMMRIHQEYPDANKYMIYQGSLCLCIEHPTIADYAVMYAKFFLSRTTRHYVVVVVVAVVVAVVVVGGVGGVAVVAVVVVVLDALLLLMAHIHRWTYH